MQIAKIIFEIAIALFVIDRLGLWLEAKGWLYWRKKKPSSGGGTNALEEFNAILNPQARHTIEMKQAPMKDETQKGDGTDDT